MEIKSDLILLHTHRKIWNIKFVEIYVYNYHKIKITFVNKYKNCIFYSCPFQQRMNVFQSVGYIQTLMMQKFVQQKLFGRQ